MGCLTLGFQTNSATAPLLYDERAWHSGALGPRGRRWERGGRKAGCGRRTFGRWWANSRAAPADIEVLTDEALNTGRRRTKRARRGACGASSEVAMQPNFDFAAEFRLCMRLGGSAFLCDLVFIEIAWLYGNQNCVSSRILAAKSKFGCTRFGEGTARAPH